MFINTLPIGSIGASPGYPENLGNMTPIISLSESASGHKFLQVFQNNRIGEAAWAGRLWSSTGWETRGNDRGWSV